MVQLKKGSTLIDHQVLKVVAHCTVCRKGGVRKTLHSLYLDILLGEYINEYLGWEVNGATTGTH